MKNQRMKDNMPKVIRYIKYDIPLVICYINDDISPVLRYYKDNIPQDMKYIKIISLESYEISKIKYLESCDISKMICPVWKSIYHRLYTIPQDIWYKWKMIIALVLSWDKTPQAIIPLVIWYITDNISKIVGWWIKENIQIPQVIWKQKIWKRPQTKIMIVKV